MNFKNKIFKSIFFTLICITFSFSVFSQEFEKEETDKQKSKLSDNIFFGGSFGLQFGTITYIQAEPIVGYRLTPRVSLGVGGMFTYLRNSQYDYTTYFYGPMVFAQAFIYKEIYLHTELEMLNIEKFDAYGYSENNRIWLPGVKAGLGYQKVIAGRLRLNACVLWNFTQTEDTPYSNPIIRIGMIF